MKTTYSVPRYLGLQSVFRHGEKTDLEFGYTSDTHKSVTVDADGENLIYACLQPKSVQRIKRDTGLHESKISEALNELERSGIVKRTLQVPKKMQRYDRHLLFFDLQGQDAIAAQRRISNARIALIGMGGIGSWVSLGLIGAGFKELRLIDFDRVELSNLTRQILFTESDLGASKTAIARQRLSERNSQTKITAIDKQIRNTRMLKKYLVGIDFVVLSADRPAEIHDWVDEVCGKLRIPYINLGYRDGSGVIGPMTIVGETSCYQCHKSADFHFAKSKENLLEDFENRYQAPSFGPLNSLVSSLGVLEIIKQVAQIGPCQSLGVELQINPISFEIEKTNYNRDPECSACRGKPNAKPKTRKART